MKTGLLVARFLEIGMGLLLIYVGNHRKNNIPKNKNQKYWKKASNTSLILGWFILVFSTLSMLGYLLTNTLYK